MWTGSNVPPKTPTIALEPSLMMATLRMQSGSYAAGAGAEDDKFAGGQALKPYWATRMQLVCADPDFRP